MSLAAKSWRPVSVHDVVAEFLLSERDKSARILPQESMVVVDNPNTNDPAENHFRLRLLYYFRCFLVAEIPPDTQWFEVRSLTDYELVELRVIGRCGWDDPADANELVRVARRRPQPLRDDVATWRKPILWGHGRAGPFTILEGNNRLTAYVTTNNPPGLSISVLVGLSPTPCCFHMPDPPNVLANDLWKPPGSWPTFRQ